jgi:hypothetical protein
MSVEFKKISTSERARWDKLAAEDKERYQAAMEDYVPPASEKKTATAPKA